MAAANAALSSGVLPILSTDGSAASRASLEWRWASASIRSCSNSEHPALRETAF